jgi:hydrogenase expression/formation protein HypD
MSVHIAKRRGLKNFSLLVSHVLVPPAIAAILDSPGNQVQAFLLAGHVCSVMGYWEYPPVAEKYQIPLVVTGFEPLDLLDGIRRAVIQLEKGAHEVENAYERIVTFVGNQAAQTLLAEVFEVTDRAWRGIGVIPKSGWRLSPAYRDFDAEIRFQIQGIRTVESPLCRAGDVLRGSIKPAECGAFGKECTPRHPLGATMVSSEGACAAYFNYGRFLSAEQLAGVSGSDGAGGH